MNNFKIEALNHQQFEYLNQFSDNELKINNIIKITVDKFPGYPCRTTLEDAEIGEEVYLLNFNFHKTDSPYQANGPIYIRKNKPSKFYNVNEIPKMFTHRFLSLRGYNQQGILKLADAINGENLKEKIHSFFENSEIEYIHIHNAKPGCLNCNVIRA